MILGLRTAIYPAPDLAAAKRWYTEALGQPPYFDEPFYVGFAVGGFELGLLPNAQPGTTGPQPLWGVSNIESEFARLIELGAIGTGTRDRSRRRHQGGSGTGPIRQSLRDDRESLV